MGIAHLGMRDNGLVWRLDRRNKTLEVAVYVSIAGVVWACRVRVSGRVARARGWCLGGDLVDRRGGDILLCHAIGR